MQIYDKKKNKFVKLSESPAKDKWNTFTDSDFVKPYLISKCDHLFKENCSTIIISQRKNHSFFELFTPECLLVLKFLI